ncbi:MAG: hypothetical protein HFG48_00025 [Bacilli bacterium]|nr:hypothetical protein [Bacilli bacterium]
MKIKSEELLINESLYKKVYNLCEFSNLKLKFINGVVFRIKDTNANYLEPHRFIIRVQDYTIELLCYDNLHLYLFYRETRITVARVKDLIDYLKEVQNG